MEANEFANWSSLEITATFQFIAIALITPLLRAFKFALVNGSTQLKELADARFATDYAVAVYFSRGDDIIGYIIFD